MRNLKNLNLKGKRVLLRCDFNVPLSDSGEILDDFRIRETLPTIKYLVQKGAKIILISHLGRPQEIRNSKLKIKKFSLRPVAKLLSHLLAKEVKFLNDCVGPEAERGISKMQPGEVILLENVRFYKEELENDVEFSKKLANLGDFYINDAFATVHRNQASITGIPRYLPSGAGFLLEKEMDALRKIRDNPGKPLISIIGGAKVKTKTGAINSLSRKADFILVGGLIACEIKKKNIKLANSGKIIFPVEDVCAFDISPKTISLFEEKIKTAKTIFWSGPLGKIEERKYQKGSKEIALAVAKSGAFSVIGGGQIVGFINKLGLAKKFNHISTGGGAMLAFLSGEKLPGLEALEYYNDN